MVFQLIKILCISNRIGVIIVFKNTELLCTRDCYKYYT